MAPKRKDPDVTAAKEKSSKKSRARQEDSGDEVSPEPEPEKPARKVKKPRVSAPDEEEEKPADADGDSEDFVDLGKKKRVSISNFKGTNFVDIREYYQDKEGEMKPGKKGIALSAEQWEALKANIDTIDRSFRKVEKKK